MFLPFKIWLLANLTFYIHSLDYISVGQCCCTKYKTGDDLCRSGPSTVMILTGLIGSGTIILFPIVMMLRSLFRILQCAILECRTLGKSFLFLRA